MLLERVSKGLRGEDSYTIHLYGTTEEICVKTFTIMSPRRKTFLGISFDSFAIVIVKKSLETREQQSHYLFLRTKKYEKEIRRI